MGIAIDYILLIQYDLNYPSPPWVRKELLYSLKLFHFEKLLPIKKCPLLTQWAFFL